MVYAGGTVVANGDTVRYNVPLGSVSACLLAATHSLRVEWRYKRRDRVGRRNLCDEHRFGLAWRSKICDRGRYRRGTDDRRWKDDTRRIVDHPRIGSDNA